jgi:glutamine amidotransferase
VIAIVDYDMGNVASVANMLRRIRQVDVRITRDPAVIRDATKIILPGVGAFDKGMRNINEFGLRDSLDEAALGRKVPILGICLGMQLLTSSSEEGSERGLGWVDATTMRFKFDEGSTIKVPHMGWNYVSVAKPSPLFSDERSRFYFVHGYYVKCRSNENVLATSTYGFEFACSISHENIYGVQFHPEKSHRFGMKLLEGFIGI